MRGPHERLKYDLRRVWECPVCHHRERTPGDTTSQICRCQEKEEFVKRTPMRLVEDGPRRILPWPPRPVDSQPQIETPVVPVEVVEPDKLEETL